MDDEQVQEILKCCQGVWRLHDLETLLCAIPAGRQDEFRDLDLHHTGIQRGIQYVKTTLRNACSTSLTYSSALEACTNLLEDMTWKSGLREVVSDKASPLADEVVIVITEYALKQAAAHYAEMKP